MWDRRGAEKTSQVVSNGFVQHPGPGLSADCQHHHGGLGWRCQLLQGDTMAGT